MNWTLFDFVLAGIFLCGIGLTYKLVTKKSLNAPYRVAAGIAILLSILLIGINGAVGIIGSENNPANLLYVAVLLVVIIGAAISRLEARGMSYTLFAVAIAQILVYIIAQNSEIKVFVLNAFFALSWSISALLFRRATKINRTN